MRKSEAAAFGGLFHFKQAMSPTGGTSALGPEIEVIASSANRSVRRVFVRQDRPKQNPTRSVESHHLELLVDAPIIRCG